MPYEFRWEPGDEAVFWIGPGVAAGAAARQGTWDELNARVDSLYQQQRYAEAVTAARKLLGFAEQSFGAETPNVASCLNKLAVLYEEEGNLATTRSRCTAGR